MHRTEIGPARADGSFNVSSRRLDGGILIALSGDLDLATAPIVDSELRRVEPENVVVLDLQDVSFMDSSGIRTVISAHQRLRGQGASLQIVNVPAHIIRLFELVGISSHLEIADGRDGSTARADAVGGD